MPGKVAGLQYGTKRIIIDVKDISLFARLANPRPLRESQVAYLKRVLGNGGSLKTPIVVNDVGTGGHHYRVVDGNHRLEAIKQLLESRPDLRFEAEFCIYNHLSEKQEAELFEAVNRAVKVTPLDMFTVRQKEYPIVALLQQGFPTYIGMTNTTVKKGFRILTFLRAYAFRLNPIVTGGTWKDADRTWTEIKSLGEKDYESMKEFAEDFIEAFGEPGSMNPFSKISPLFSLMKIYYWNLHEKALDRDEIVDRWKQKVANDPVCRSNVIMTGIHAQKHTIQNIVVAMNRGFTRKLALIPGSMGTVKEEVMPL